MAATKKPRIGNALNAEPGPPKCDECPLSRYPGRGDGEKEYVPSSIVPYAPVVFIGMAPGKEEVVAQEVFIGPAGRVLDMGLGSARIDRPREASLVNLLACKVPNSPGKQNDWSLAGQPAVKACAPRFVRDLIKASPKLIVTLGVEPLHAVDPSAGTEKLSRLRGYVRPFEHRGKPYQLVPLYHPASLLYDPSPSNVAHFNRDLRTVKEIIDASGKNKNTHRKSRLPGDGRRTDGIGIQEAPMDWSVGALRLPIPDAVLDVESTVLAKRTGKTRLLCVGVAAYPRSSERGKNHQHTRPRVRVVPVEEFPRHLTGLRRLIGHNTPHDYAAIRGAGLVGERDQVELEDTMVMGSLVDENREQGLKTYAEEMGYPRYWEEVEHFWDQKPPQDPPREVLHKYNACDVALTSDLFGHFTAELSKQPRVMAHYQNFLKPCLRLAAELHMNGLHTLPSLATEIPLMKRRIKYQANKLFNIAGIPAQERTLDLLRKKDWLKEFLFTKVGLNLTPSKRHRTKVLKDPQLNRAHFEYLMDKDPTGAVAILFDLSFKQKEYTDLKAIEHLAGQLIHPRYNLGGTGERDDEGRAVRTGRWSAQDPNIQQFADYIKRHVGSRYENGFLFQWDGSQIEVRMAAQHSLDPHLLAVFENDLDCYIDAATTVFGKQKARERRFMGKRSLLAAIYGVGKRKLRKELNGDLIKLGFSERVTDDDCQGFLDALFQKISRHKEWINDTRDFARRHGYVDALTGRRRRLPLAMADDAHALNQAINYPISHLAHCANTLSAIRFGWKFDGGVLCTLVHDSGVGDARNLNTVVKAEKRAKHIWANLPMKEVFGVTLKVPMKIDFKAGRTWHPLVPVSRLIGDK